MDVLLAVAGQLDTALGEPTQEHLLSARHTQAMSFIFHIPLVCFGIAFPAMVLFTEGLWLRTGDPVYKALAKRWSKVMLILFAVGVVTGTILSFELGLLWPNFMATFGDVFGLAFAAFAAPVQLVVGDWAARTVAKDQPVKLAAFEGLAKTERDVAFHIGGI